MSDLYYVPLYLYSSHKDNEISALDGFPNVEMDHYRVYEFNTSMLYHTMAAFNAPEQKSFENIVGKGENADY